MPLERGPALTYDWIAYQEALARSEPAANPTVDFA